MIDFFEKILDFFDSADEAITNISDIGDSVSDISDTIPDISDSISDLEYYGEAPDFVDNDLSYNNPEHGNAISFLGNANSDGYIPDGTIKLERTISGTTDTFKLFSKDGHDYVLVNGSYIRVDGVGTVTINNIKYDKIS
jgi:hypothetical protein